MATVRETPQTQKYSYGVNMFDDRRLVRQQPQVVDLHRSTIGFQISGGGIAAMAQSHHDRRRVSIDYRRGRGNRVCYILRSRACFYA